MMKKIIFILFSVFVLAGVANASNGDIGEEGLATRSRQCLADRVYCAEVDKTSVYRTFKTQNDSFEYISYEGGQGRELSMRIAAILFGGSNKDFSRATKRLKTVGTDKPEFISYIEWNKNAAEPKPLPGFGLQGMFGVLHNNITGEKHVIMTLADQKYNPTSFYIPLKDFYEARARALLEMKEWPSFVTSEKESKRTQGIFVTHLSNMIGSPYSEVIYKTTTTETSKSKVPYKKVEYFSQAGDFVFDSEGMFNIISSPLTSVLSSQYLNKGTALNISVDPSKIIVKCLSKRLTGIADEDRKLLGSHADLEGVSPLKTLSILAWLWNLSADPDQVGVIRIVVENCTQK